MAEFVVKIADDRGHLLEQVENGYSEAEVRDRFVQQGFLVYWVKPRGVFSGGLRRRGTVKQIYFSKGEQVAEGGLSRRGGAEWRQATRRRSHR